MAPPRILYLIHRADWTSSRIAEVLQGMGYAVDFLCHPDGETLPDDTSPWAGFVIAGGMDGSMIAPERWPWLMEEAAWARKLVDESRPVLGLCLGAQIIALAHGGRGGPRPDGMMELGFCPIEATEEGRELFRGLDHIYQAHYEGITDLPEDAELLATSAAFPVQAYRLGSAIGLQGHPDARGQDIADWFGDNETELTRPGIQPLAEQLVMARRYEASIQDWTERFLTAWIGPASEFRSL